MTIPSRFTSVPRDSSYSDVHFVAEPSPTVSYRSGLTVYEESLVRGQLVGRSWNGAGFIGPEAERFDPSTHPAPRAFWIEFDGQLLGSHWELATRGLPIHLASALNSELALFEAET